MLDLILQDLEGIQTPLGKFSASPAQTLFLPSHYVFMSVKNHFKFEVNMHAKESKGVDLLPEKLWAAFISMQGHHFHYHKPNCSADFHICFLPIDSCTESAPRREWINEALVLVYL